MWSVFQINLSLSKDSLLKNKSESKLKQYFSEQANTQILQCSRPSPCW